MLKQLLIDLLKCPSITPNEAGVFDICKAALSEFSASIIAAPDEAPEHLKASNLLLRRECNASGSIHFVFGCHADVVPAGSGWLSEPFNPVEKNGRIYARGASDMKSGLAAAIAAAAAFKPEQNPHIASLSLLITSDEEGEGTYGSAYALRHLADTGVFFTHALITEPTCSALFGDTIKTARRGSIHARIRFIGQGGHIAYANQCANPIELASPAIAALAGAYLDNGVGVFEPSKFVISNIHAGSGSLNVSPHELVIDANVRNCPATSEDDVKALIKRVCSELAAVKDGRLKLEISTRTSSLPFSCDSSSPLVAALAASVAKISGVVPECNAAGGTSDSRHFAAFGAHSCEFGPRNESIHAPNEFVIFDEVAKCEQIYLETLRRINAN